VEIGKRPTYTHIINLFFIFLKPRPKRPRRESEKMIKRPDIWEQLKAKLEGRVMHTAEENQWRQFDVMAFEARRNGSMIQINGQWFLNCTPHEIRLEDGTVINGSTWFAEKLKATPVQRPIFELSKGGFEFVETRFSTNEIAESLVRWAKAKQIILIGSIIAAQAFGFPVVSPIATPETSRKPPQERICYKYKWNTKL